MWLKTEFSEIDTLADENWEWLKPEAGLPPDGWKIEQLSRRDDSQNSSITRLVSHKVAGRFTYKFQLRPHSPEGFRKHFDFQQVAYDSFPHSAEFTLPKPVFVHEERQISLISYIEGKPVSEAMKQLRSEQEQLTMLTRCGAWLDVFHRSQGFEVRQFRPDYTLKYYQNFRDQILSGERDVAVRSLFLRGIDKLSEISLRLSGRETVAAQQHGDFHLRNLIWNNGLIAGIDVSKDHTAPVGYDIAKVLLDFTTVFRPFDNLADGQIVHRDTLDAFFDGYTLVGPDDPGVQLLLCARILATLNTVPAKKKDRTDAKQRTLDRLRPFARNAFRKGTPPER